MSIINRTRLRASRSTRVGLAAAAIAACMAPGVADAHLEAPGRRAPDSCTAIVVQPGDTVWAIATANGITLDRVAELNPQITNLSVVRPGDEIAVTCDPQGTALAPAVSVSRPVDVSKWMGEVDGTRMSDRAIVAWLYELGMRGDDLVTMAAITPGESGGNMAAVGDTAPRFLTPCANGKGTWVGSFGVFQIRACSSHRGTGSVRDQDRVQGTVAGNFSAAVELYESARERRDKGEINKVTGKVWTPFDDWSAYLNGWHIGNLNRFHAAAAEIGVL
jgi:hypothetical protein